MREHKPYWCANCSSEVLKADDSEAWAVWGECSECAYGRMCDACFDYQEETINPNGREFKACLRTLNDVNARLADSDMSTFSGGGVRSSDTGKPRFDLLTVSDMPYEDQIMTRAAIRMAEGAERYGVRNFEKMNDREAFERCKASLLRHVFQYVSGETDEQHLAAVVCNAVMLSSIERYIND